MAKDCDRRELEDLGFRFGSKLKLSEKEKEGINIERKEVEGALLGFQYTLIAEVLTTKEVNGEAFIDCFMSLWRGREGVSIRDIGERRFLARCTGQRDLSRVVDADQPWTFKHDLVLVADRTESGLNRWAPLSVGTFWVQIHNVPPFSMTMAVAESIGGLMGIVRRIDTAGSRDCIGRFLRVKINFNVREPLMRGTYVKFPDEGKVWIDFKLEALPRYCLICGMLGHATRVCKSTLCESGRQDADSGNLEEEYAFRGLDAVTDLRGKLLGLGPRSRGSVRSNGGDRSSGTWKEDRSEEHEGMWKSGRSSTASGTGFRTPSGGRRSRNEEGSQDNEDEEVIDTAISPSKPRWSSNRPEQRNPSLAINIQRQRNEEEEARKARERAFDEGLIGPGGVVADGVEHVVLKELCEKEDGEMVTAKSSLECTKGFNLNVVMQTTDEVEQDRPTRVNKPLEQMTDQTGREGTNTASSDPFDLEPIIKAVTKEQRRKK
ncbi:hypothetical protein ACFX19_045215 [Malus domestica]